MLQTNTVLHYKLHIVTDFQCSSLAINWDGNEKDFANIIVHTQVKGKHATN